MPYSYYEDLSGDDRSDNDDDSSLASALDDDDNDSIFNHLGVKSQKHSKDNNYNNNNNFNSHQQLDDRIILHVDVDCFYCQCETLDRNLPPDRPLAIGQKHIIVTCNYLAREKYGISKLQNRQEALRKCPHLLIVEGSDLERYRQHARRIYECFRKVCKTHFKSSSSSNSSSNNHKNSHSDVAVCKGSMDEMMADLSLVVGFCDDDNDDDDNDKKKVCCKQDKGLSSSDEWLYIFGEQSQERTTLTEDQSGATTTTVLTMTNQSRYNDAIFRDGSEYYTLHQETRLQRAAGAPAHYYYYWAQHIRECILHETGFTTTCGISTNPMLAKIASGLRKPGGVNVLYPWRSQDLLLAMPLRKIPGLGRRTCQVLDPCLRRAFSMQNKHLKNPFPDFWTCRDLLQVPRDDIIRHLERVPAFQKNCRQQCDRLLRQCRGQDDSTVVDDGGGLPKTVSVENSFRRGTICSSRAVLGAMEDLYERLPRLVHNRKAWSDMPLKAYPTTLRLTVRLVDNTIQKKRPFATRSKQMSIDGAQNFLTNDLLTQRDSLRRLVEPLLHSLVLSNAKVGIDITRINIAVSNFQDLKQQQPPPPPPPPKKDATNVTMKDFSQVSSQGTSKPLQKIGAGGPIRSGMSPISNPKSLEILEPSTHPFSTQDQERSGSRKRKGSRIDDFFISTKSTMYTRDNCNT